MNADFLEWLTERTRGRTIISIRDILTWVEFMNIGHAQDIKGVDAYMHGAAIMLLDRLGTSSVARNAKVAQGGASQLRSECENFLLRQLEGLASATRESVPTQSELKFCERDDKCGIDPFFIARG